MNNQCTDRDLLALEPVIFLGAGLGTQQLAAGVNGQTAGTTFTATGAELVSSGVQAGMVLTTYHPANGAAEGSPFEIVEVLSETQMTISVLRPTLSSPAIAPLPAGNGYIVRTYRPQIQGVYDTMMERLRQLSELSVIDASHYTDSPQLRLALVCGALASIFVTRAQSADAKDPNYIKAQHYQKEFARLATALRLSADGDADGSANVTRSLGNVTLRRV